MEEYSMDEVLYHYYILDNVSERKRVKREWVFPQADMAAPWDFPWALSSRNPSEQPCQPLDKPISSLLFSFHYISQYPSDVT